MIQMDRDEELRDIQKKLVLISLIDAPGAIFVGLGLYAIFGANGNAFIDLLNDPDVAYGLILVGGVIITWSATSMFSLLKRKAQLANGQKARRVGANSVR